MVKQDHRNYTLNKLRTYGSAKNYKEYKLFSIVFQVNRMVRQDHRKYKSKLIHSFKNNPKRFNGYMRNTQQIRVNVNKLADKKMIEGLNQTWRQQVLCISFQKFLIKIKDVENSRYDSGTSEQPRYEGNAESVDKKKLETLYVISQPECASSVATFNN